MAYAFEHGLINGRVQLTKDKKAVAIWKNHTSRKMNVPLLLENLKFLLAFGVKRIIRITKMELDIATYYPKDTPFDYLWFIGTLPSEQGKGYGASLLNPVISNSRTLQKPVYLETTTAPNIKYYKRKGFELYKTMAIGQKQVLQVSLLRVGVQDQNEYVQI